MPRYIGIMNVSNNSHKVPSTNGDPGWGKRNIAGVLSIASKLVLRDISHAYGNVQVLKNISLSIEPGQMMCLLGPSGSGKTTLLRIVAGIEQQDSGSVLFDDRKIAGSEIFLPPEKRGIGLVFQDYALFPHLTILDNVKFGLNKQSARDAENQARQVIARVGLEQLAKAYPHELSGGEQQRVALARALAPRPGILLMDEPFSGLDARLRESVRDETLTILRESRATAIMVTHDPEEALRMGDRIALLKNGELVQEGDGETLFQKPNSLFSASFFTELNVYRDRIKNGVIETSLGAVDAGEFANGEEVYASVRLSDVIISTKEGAGNRARVTSHRYLGVVDQVELQLDGYEQRLRARVRHGQISHEVIAGRKDVYVSARPEDIRLYPVN